MKNITSATLLYSLLFFLFVCFVTTDAHGQSSFFCGSDATVLSTLNLGGTVQGSFEATAGTDQRGRFQIEIAEEVNSSISVNFTFTGTLQRIVTLCDSSDALVNLVSEQGGPQVMVINARLRPGTYYINIISGRSSRNVQYELQVSEDVSYNEFLSDCEDATTTSVNFNDPLYGCQWHLKNRGGLVFQGGTAGEDINVEEVWLGGTTGSGVNVAVVDTGLDFRHEDLSGNVNTALNHSYTSSSVFNSTDTHGTSVAGMIASVGGNGIGVRGVAPQSTIYGYNLLENLTSVNEADAMTRNLSVTAVSNNSWGDLDDPLLHSASSTWEMAVEEGVKTGFGGKGIFYNWPSGNGHRVDGATAIGDQANYEEYNSYYAVTSVCSVDKHGVQSSFSEEGVNLWVCAPGDEVTSTINSDRYDGQQSGTSFSTPVVSGVAALVRETNSELSWRDVKLILAASARKNDESDPGWETVGVKYGSVSERYNYNSKYGFGVVDAEEAAGLAESWSIVPSMRTLTVSSGDINQGIPDEGSTEHTMTLPGSGFFTEFVEVTLRFTHSFFFDLSIQLVSPTGTVSEIVESRPPRTAVFILPSLPSYTSHSHRFGSAKHLGENPSGTWTLRISDNEEQDTGTLHSWSIKVYGHELPSGLTFGAQTISDQNYINGVAITPLDLPEATGGNAPLTYSLTGLPAGLRLENGQLVGTPAEVVSGRTVTYTVRDADGDTETITFMITVVAYEMPTFGAQTISDRIYLQNSAINSIVLPQARGGNGPLNYSLFPLPDGFVFDRGTRVLSGTPAAAGSTDLTYTARDADGNEAILTFNIRVIGISPRPTTQPSNPVSPPGNDTGGGGGGGCTVSGHSSDFSDLPGAIAFLILTPLLVVVRRKRRIYKMKRYSLRRSFS